MSRTICLAFLGVVGAIELKVQPVMILQSTFLHATTNESAALHGYGFHAAVL